MTAPQGKDDMNKVKVVCDQAGFALYFSRSPIPAGDGDWLCHLGIYAYRHATLKRYAALPPSALERREKLEQLRLLESGQRIRIVAIPPPTSPRHRHRGRSKTSRRLVKAVTFWRSSAPADGSGKMTMDGNLALEKHPDFRYK